MDDKQLTDERRLVAARLTPEIWRELDAIRRSKRWTWQVFLEEIILAFLTSQRRRSEGGK